MKTVLFAILTLFTAQAFSQVSIDLRTVGSSVELDFTNGFVCKVDPAFSSAPTLGYGPSSLSAESQAINNCIAETGNHRMHCSKSTCEKISFANRPVISVSVQNGQVGVRFSTGSKIACYTEAAFGGGIFVAEAPTKLEAEVYSQKLCMEQTGNARMHCRIKACENLVSRPGRRGISFGGVTINL